MALFKKFSIFLTLSFFICLAFLFSKNHFLKNRENTVQEVSGVVVSVDNTDIIRSGAGTVGIQHVECIITRGKFKGIKTKAINHLNGQLDMDEIYNPGDRLLFAVQVEDQKIVDAKTINRYRQNWEFALFLVFAISLIAYSKTIGFKALVSFLASLGILWCFYIPNMLKGCSPLPLTLAVLILLSLVIIIMVAGPTKQGFAAFFGTISGMAVTLVLTLFFGYQLKLSGMTTPFSTLLLVQGGYGLNFQHIFYSAVLIGASGAAMDIAMDVSVSMNEIKLKRPDLGIRELIQSGFNVGRMVIGTMATTLLLAYSGGYLTMLMVFVLQGTTITRILNMKLVAAEIFRILIGSIGLLMVAPVTAIIAGILLSIEFKNLNMKKLFSVFKNINKTHYKESTKP